MRSNTIPVIILGGQDNALSITRSLGSKGVHMTVVAPDKCLALHSRYCQRSVPVSNDQDFVEFCTEYLLERELSTLRGSIVFPCSDEAIEFVYKNRARLEKVYILDEQKAELQEAMLDKERTLELAKKIGCAVPQHWKVETMEDIRNIEADMSFPVLIKPIHSYLFEKRFGKKLMRIESLSDFREKAKKVFEEDLEFMICELIPGPDTLLSSYYTHIDKDGNELFHFTKKVIRRFKPNFGAGCYHITEWLPDTAEMGNKFFRGLGFTGLGNVEFKYDTRDNQLKIIECNARFTAAQELLVRSGMDIAWILYKYLSTGERDAPASYKNYVRLWYPIQDYGSFRELKKGGQITTWGWIKSIAHRQVFPRLKFSDPVPFLVNIKRERLLERIFSWLR